MLFTSNKFISCLLSLLLLQISISVKPKKILTDEEKLKKGFFLDSYAISQSQIYLHTNFSKEICIDQTVRKGLADCLMHRRIIDTVAAPCFKGNFDVFLQFVINAEIKITEISGPFAGAGLKPVCPADGWVQHLPVIQEILRELTD